MDGRERLGRLAQQAEQLVRRHRGREISLRDPTVVAARERCLVVRCAVTGWDGVASVVLKRNEGDDERGFTDWASLAFLSTLEEATGIAPHFYAGDARERFFVVATSGREEIFERMRATLPGGAGLGRRREAARWLEARKRVARWAAALDLALPHGFDVACAHIAAVYADPGPYLTFSHGDPAPSNNHIATGGVRLVDFEYAGYRHALYDITAWDTLCPLPKEWMAAMEQVFRCAVGASPLGGSFLDDEQYWQAWATMCAYRALAM